MEVGPFTVIGPDVVIGEGSWIGPHAVINGPTRIGKNNKIFQFASVGEIPQDKKYKGEDTLLEIGDGNVIRECCTINRGTIQGGGTTRWSSQAHAPDGEIRSMACRQMRRLCRISAMRTRYRA